MHSFTSSSNISNLNVWERNIPEKNWKKLFFISIFIFISLALAWELYCRSNGYAPSIDDNKDLWAHNRKQVEKKPDATVLIGASRMLFNFDLSVYQTEFNSEPIQLSTVGTNATYYLDDLANNSSFHGTLIMDVLPMLLFVPEGQPVNTPVGNLKYFKDWNYAQIASFYLGLVPDQLLSFLEPEDLSMRSLLAEIPLSNRVGTKLPPKLPPYFLEIHDLNRQGLMTHKAETDVAFQQLIQQRWTPLFTPPPAPEIFTKEQFMKMFMDHVDATIVKMKNNISKIQARGGKVILVRYPSTHTVWELENKFSPNPAFWNRIKDETGANFALSFEDYPELQGFSCPEWSHLNRSDATEFTKRLLKILKDKNAL